MASLVLGLTGIPFFWAYGIAPILAVVFGAVARSRSRKSGVKPSGMATAGLVLGIIGIVLGVVMFVGLMAWDTG